MLVEEIMETDVVTCGYESSLRDAATRMVEQEVGSIIVVRSGHPYGILTETDALYAGATTNLPYEGIPVAEILSHPLVTVAPDKTVKRAVQTMEEHGIKKLPVVDGIDLQGILTRSDLVRHHDELLNEVRDLEKYREQWEHRKGDIDRFG